MALCLHAARALANMDADTELCSQVKAFYEDGIYLAHPIYRQKYVRKLIIKHLLSLQVKNTHAKICLQVLERNSDKIFPGQVVMPTGHMHTG